MAVTGSLQTKGGKYYVLLNLYDSAGNRKQKWVGTGLEIKGNKRRAELAMRQILEEWKDKNVDYSYLTVADYFEKWIEEIKHEVKPNTFRSYHDNMKNHIIPYFRKQKILLQDLKPYHLEDYYRSKLQPHSKLDGSTALSPTTIKHHHQNISKALSDAYRRGIINTNPASAARTPKQKKFKAEFLNPSQLDELLLLFKGSVVELPVKLCAVYGFRRSEVLGLKWGNVDFQNRTITIAETLQQHLGGSYTDSPKTESSYRTLPMTDTVYDILTNHRKEQQSREALMGNYYVKSDYVCTWNDGSVIEPNYLTRVFHEVVSKSTLPHIRLHDLRHSVASNLLNNGFSVVQVQEWLGHGSASTTLNFYAHVDKTSKQTIAGALEKMIKLG